MEFEYVCKSEHILISFRNHNHHNHNQKTGGFPSRLHEASESSKFKSFPKSPRIGHVDVEFAKETHSSVEDLSIQVEIRRIPSEIHHLIISCKNISYP